MKGEVLPYTILLVDDSVTARTLVRRELERHGHVVVEAADGEAALSTLDSIQPALVISDVNMGPMNGLALLLAIRRQYSPRQLPVLMLTTEATDDLKAQGRAAGATGWLVKPFDPERMGAVIAHVLAVNANSEAGPAR
jgi:two-component system, chemotaxis family, chemotaxis protein CheY